MPDWEQDAKNVEQEFTGDGQGQQSEGMQSQEQSSGGMQQEQQGQSQQQSSGGSDTMMNDVVDSGVDYVAGKEGMSAAFDPEVNNELNKVVDKEF